MNYEDRYNEALKIARDNYNAADSANINVNSFKNTLTTIFPELKESDEKIRQFLIHEVTETSDEIMSYRNMNKKEVLDWLEKQESVGEIVERCKDSWYNEGKIQGKIEGLSDDEKYQQGWHDALEKQGEQKREWSEEDERILKTIIINIENLEFSEEMREKCYPIPSANKDYYQIRIDWLKSLKDRIQSRQSNKVEPKFKVGDWVVRKDGENFSNGSKFVQITKIDKFMHWFDCGTWLKDKELRLWNIEDAKDGDILYSKEHNLLWRYKDTKHCYFCINLNYNYNNFSTDGVIVMPNDVRPATKEQRDLLFSESLQHVFSEINDKKELKKQGEHKPTDNGNKIEPKFHEGDWIVVRGEAILICDIRNDLYDVIFADGEHRLYDTNVLDKEGHLWTIEDAKDGDVLVASDDSIFIFAGVVDDTCKYYAALPFLNGVSINKEVEFGFWELANYVHPATKEQCDLLFAKMREKGYEWNNEKKEVIGRI